MSTQITKLSLLTSLLLFLPSGVNANNENLLLNGSFEDFSIQRDHGKWKEVTFDHWKGKGEVWNKNIGKNATDGGYKVELDVGTEFNSLSQEVQTQKDTEYTLTLDAYARVAGSSNFEIWIDDYKLKSIDPTPSWKTYTITFVGNGTNENIQIKEIASQNNGLGAIIDNITLRAKIRTDDSIPSLILIQGEPAKEIAQYGYYDFKPFVEGFDSETTEFKITNKPSWATFNSITGELSGTPTTIGKTEMILISAKDGDQSAILAPFQIEVTDAIDLAQTYGKATQPPKNSYRWYRDPNYIIDGDSKTSNHTEGSAENNWVELELPRSTKIHKVMIQGRSASKWRLGGASVYLSNKPYSGSFEESEKIGTLKGNATEQFIEFSEGKEGTYIVIKGKDKRHIHLVTVSAYGELSYAPSFEKYTYTTTIDKWQNRMEEILTVKANDYQGDTLDYSIKEDVPFTINEEGVIHVDGLLSEPSYTFTVLANDGEHISEQSVTIEIIENAIVKELLRSNNSRPSVTGYVPNNYNSGDVLTVTIADKSYEAVVNEDGRWRVEGSQFDTPLEIKFYDVILQVNDGEAIVYRDYFEVYGSQLETFKLPLSMTTIETVDVAVNAHIETPLLEEEKVRGSSISLELEDGVITLVNKSYRKIKSLIGKYTDEEGKNSFVKLNFNQYILPYSSNTLGHFDHAQNMKILPTSGHYDMQISFGGKDGKVDCDASTPTTGTRYCPPTNRNDEIYSERSAQTDLSEQQVYSIAVATYHHFYNTVDGLNTMKAWVNGDSYKALDYRKIGQKSTSYLLKSNIGKASYLYKNFFRVTLPNNHVRYSSMRYHYASEGMGGGRSGNIYGTTTGGTFASSWEGALRYTNNRLQTYDTIHHESMHAIGFGHSSGMTYGWSHALKSAIPKFYSVGQTPVFNAPNYIFDTRYVNNKEVEVTLYKTAEATGSELTFEILSGKAVMDGDIKLIKNPDSDVNNKLLLSINREIDTPYFLRVYGEDSSEMMSQLLNTWHIPKTYLLSHKDPETKITTEYHAISYADWKRSAEIVNYKLRPNFAPQVCKLLLGVDSWIAYKEDLELINSNYRDAIDNTSWLTSKKFLGRVVNWKAYNTYDYSEGGYTTGRIHRTNVITDDSLNILCTVKHK